MDYKLSYLLRNDVTRKIGLQEAMNLTGFEREGLITKLNNFDYKIDEKNTLFIKPVSSLEWTSYLLNSTSNMIYELEIIERRLVIFLMILMEEDNSSIYHFQDLLKVSRGTILSDIKILRNELSELNVRILYDRNKGYLLEGNIHTVLKTARNYISKLLESEAGSYILHYFISYKSFNLYAQVRDTISHYINQTNFTFVPSRIDEIIYFSIFCKKRLLTANTSPIEEMNQIKSISMYSVVKEMLSDLYDKNLSDGNISIFMINLLTILQGNIHEPTFDFLLQLSAEIIHRVEKYAAIQFKNFRDLLFSVYNHLVPAFFRIKYDLEISNPLMETIYSEYHSVFHITKLSLQPLEKLTENTIRDEEIGYFTILFGGAINVENELELDDEKFKALIVCPNGISSSLILESELRLIFPNIDFIASESLEGIKNISKDSYDFIFSTVPIDTNKKVYTVKPIMNQREKNSLINKVHTEWLIPGLTFPNVETIIEAVGPYVTLKDGVTKEQLYRVLNRKINTQFEKDDTYSLKDYLKADYIHFKEKSDSWEEAVRTAAATLLAKGFIDEYYVDSMIQSINKYGAYIYMGSQVALPHASPEDGVYKTGFSMLVLDEPINILDDPSFSTRIIIVLASVDNKQHLKALNDLTTILSKDNCIQRILHTKNKKEILGIIRKG